MKNSRTEVRPTGIEDLKLYSSRDAKYTEID